MPISSQFLAHSACLLVLFNFRSSGSPLAARPLARRQLVSCGPNREQCQCVVAWDCKATQSYLKVTRSNAGTAGQDKHNHATEICNSGQRTRHSRSICALPAWQYVTLHHIRKSWHDAAQDARSAKFAIFSKRK